MNDIFREFFRRFVLVFFDNILVYSKSCDSHLQHLKTVLETLRLHHLQAKRGKCKFYSQQVEYLGHIITPNGIVVDQKKIKIITQWSLSSTPKALKYFLGLTGYYRKFVKRVCLYCSSINRDIEEKRF